MAEQPRTGSRFLRSLFWVFIVWLSFTFVIRPITWYLYDKYGRPKSYYDAVEKQKVSLQREADSIAYSKTFPGQASDVAFCIIKSDSTKDLAYIEAVHDRVQVETTERRDSLKSFYLLYVRYLVDVYTDFDNCSSAYYSGDSTHICSWSDITLKQYDTLANQYNLPFVVETKKRYDMAMNNTKLNTKAITSGSSVVSRKAVLNMLNKKLDVLKGVYKNHYEIIFGEEYPK